MSPLSVFVAHDAVSVLLHVDATMALWNRIGPKTATKLGGCRSIRLFMETYAHAIHGIIPSEPVFDTPEAQSNRPSRKAP